MKVALIILAIVFFGLVVPVGMLLLHCIYPDSKFTIFAKRLCLVFIAIILIAAFLPGIISFFTPTPREEKIRDKLIEVEEEIGLDGILDYVLEYMDPWEIVEYVLPEYF